MSSAACLALEFENVLMVNLIASSAGSNCGWNIITCDLQNLYFRIGKDLEDQRFVSGTCAGNVDMK
jgi:hypothetical protein